VRQNGVGQRVFQKLQGRETTKGKKKNSDATRLTFPPE